MSTPFPASFRRRFAALCYEALLLAAVTCVAFIPAAAANMVLHNVPLLAETVVALIILAVWWGYFRLCWHSPRGQTLPMKVWRLQLQIPTGNRPSLRQLTPLPPQTVAGMALAWWILPIGFALIHPSRQFLYDYLAGTVLTEKEATGK